MRRGATRVATVVMTVTLATGLGGCRDIPTSASVKDFCSAGEKFSASTTFPEGVAAAKKLKKVGTPSDIGKRARRGFVELVNRVLDAKNGQDFLKKNKKLTEDQGKDLRALTAYIKKTCTL
jgi:hypothetical protein